MLIKTRGIVFRSIKYSETSLICDVYTEELGLQSYIISGVRSKNAKVKASLLQVMSLLDIVAYNKNNTNLNRTKELKSALIYQSIPFDIVKSSVGIFMIELARNTIKEKETNKPLFEYLFNSFVLLDALEEGVANMHLFFAVNLCGFLGFLPSGQYSSRTPYFDLQEGSFVSLRPKHYHFISDKTAELLSILLTLNPTELHIVKAERATRFALAEKLITYYQLHLEDLPPLHSHEILKEVLS